MEKTNRGIEKSRYKWTVQVGNQWPRDTGIEGSYKTHRRMEKEMQQIVIADIDISMCVDERAVAVFSIEKCASFNS